MADKDMEKTINNLNNALQEALQENVELNSEVRNLRNWSKQDGELITKLRKSIHDFRMENVALNEKYDRETEFLIKENVKLKHELGEYKKKYGDL